MNGRFTILVGALARFVPLAGALFIAAFALTDEGRTWTASLPSSSAIVPLLALGALVSADVVCRRVRRRRASHWKGEERRRRPHHW